MIGKLYTLATWGFTRVVVCVYKECKRGKVKVVVVHNPYLFKGEYPVGAKMNLASIVLKGREAKVMVQP